MSWLSADSFLGYTTAEIVVRNTTASGTLTINAAGRDGSNVLRSTLDGKISSGVTTISDTAIVGFPFFIQSWPVSSSTPILSVDDAVAGVSHVFVILNVDGSLSAWRHNGNAGQLNALGNGFSTLLLTTPAGLITTGVWHHFGIDTKIALSGGDVTLYVDSAPYTVTGVDTKNPNFGGQWSAIYIGQGQAVMTIDFENWFVFDGAGTACNAFPGELIAEMVLPTGAGNSTQWTPSTGANWAATAKVFDGTDTPNVQSNTVGQKDLYTHAPLSRINTDIAFIQTVMIGKKVSSGTRANCHTLRSGGTDYDSANFFLPTADAWQIDGLEVDPATNAQWSVSAVDDSQLGPKLTV